MVEYKAVFNGKRRSTVGKGYKGITWEPLERKTIGTNKSMRMEPDSMVW